ncbi:hypothetical protein [Massilia glaciei]|uniref:Uncharacterized protein n=1 Tax=Massilia glaciei TaxID=1524097 RepID=A0A2U2HLL6_9BURK|nr:hypothetical protein [Massilia glaciei]PWF48316.1 hypothetical protein C7C56_012190 [Massilia glaciei]
MAGAVLAALVALLAWLFPVPGLGYADALLSWAHWPFILFLWIVCELAGPKLDELSFWQLPSVARVSVGVISIVAIVVPLFLIYSEV